MYCPSHSSMNAPTPSCSTACAISSSKLVTRQQCINIMSLTIHKPSIHTNSNPNLLPTTTYTTHESGGQLHIWPQTSTSGSPIRNLFSWQAGTPSCYLQGTWAQRCGKDTSPSLPLRNQEAGDLCGEPSPPLSLHVIQQNQLRVPYVILYRVTTNLIYYKSVNNILWHTVVQIALCCRNTLFNTT